MNATPIEQLVAAQRQFFASGRTLELAFRRQSLVALKRPFWRTKPRSTPRSWRIWARARPKPTCAKPA